MKSSLVNILKHETALTDNDNVEPDIICDDAMCALGQIGGYVRLEFQDR